MYKYGFGIIALAMLVSVTTAWAQTPVVTVTPVDGRTPMFSNGYEQQCTNGWSIVTNKGGEGVITAGGPAFYDRDVPFIEGSMNFGTGAFYASCTYVGQDVAPNKTPSTVWLGLDTFNGNPLAGIKLKQIKTLDYYTYVSEVPTKMNGNTEMWDSWTNWENPRQPIMLQFTVQLPASCDNVPVPYNRVQLTYRPWGSSVKGTLDGRYPQYIGKWLHYDCGSAGRWMQNDGDLLHSKPMAQIESWTALLAKPVGMSPKMTTLGECTLMATTTSYNKNNQGNGEYKSPGWNGSTDPEGNVNTNGTGKTVNFMVGGRMATIVWPDSTSEPRWCTESIGFRGCVDYFTLGIDKNNDGDDADTGEKVTFNFEPSASDPEVVCANMQAYDNASTSKDLQRGFQNLLMGKVCGKVTNRLNKWYELDDGSGHIVRVYAMNDCAPITNTAQIGDWWSGWGLVEKPRWTSYTAPYLLWTTENHTDLLHW